MKSVNGLKELVVIEDSIREMHCWIFVDKNFNENKKNLLNATFYFTDDEYEEEDMYDSHRAYLESATYIDIIEVYKVNHPTPTVEEIADAILYYREMDDFLD